MKRTYQIETARFSKKFEGKDMESAAVACFKRYPPKDASILTRMKLAYPQIGETNKKAARWHYIATTVLLKKAGYKVSYKL